MRGMVRGNGGALTKRGGDLARHVWEEVVG